MVKINLLPYRERREKVWLLQYLLYFGGMLLAASLVASLLWIRQNHQIGNLESEVANVQTELDKLKEVVEETRKYEEKLEALEKKVQIISQLEKNQQGPVHILDEISQKLSEHVWLTSMTEQNFQITFQGYSLSNEGIANFMKNLQKSRYFSNIELLQSVQETYPNSPEKVLNFTITLKAQPDVMEETDGGQQG